MQSPIDPNMIVFFQGKFCPLSEARVNLLTHALHYGTGIFEGIRGYWSGEEKELYLFRPQDHYERWKANARLLKMEIPLTARELCRLTSELSAADRTRRKGSTMDLDRSVEHYHEEHRQILLFLKEFEGALALAASDSEKERRAGLAQLLAMEDKLAEVREHCREEERSVESPFQMYLDEFAFEDLHTEHDLLERHSHDFCAELLAVTAPPPTEAIVGLGRRLLEQLRFHIAREESLLKQILDGRAAEEKLFLRYIQPGE